MKANFFTNRPLSWVRNRFLTLALMILGIILTIFLAGHFALIFGVGLVTLALSAVLTENWNKKYQLPISNKLWFWLALSAAELGALLSALSSPDIFFADQKTVILVGLTVTFVCFIIGWFAGKWFNNPNPK